MRKVYSLENKKELAWGFDHTGGFFIQVFDESDPEEEVLLVNADQSRTLSKFGISDEHLTYSRMVEVLMQYSKNALNDFLIVMDENLEQTLIGYAFDKKDFYNEKVFIETKKQLFDFLDSVEHNYTITDIFDLPVSLHQTKQLVVS